MISPRAEPDASRTGSLQQEYRRRQMTVADEILDDPFRHARENVRTAYVKPTMHAATNFRPRIFTDKNW
jgi:hypothetical protein